MRVSVLIPRYLPDAKHTRIHLQALYTLTHTILYAYAE